MSRRSPTRTAEAVMARVRACARLRAAWMERLWQQGETSVDQSLAIQPGEVRRILAEPQAEADRYKSFLKEEAPARLARAAAAATKALAACGYWTHLNSTFELTLHESDLLCLAVAVELDPKLGRALAYIADDVRATQATASMASALFGWMSPAEPMTSLKRWRLAHPTAGDIQARAASGWQADEAVVLSLYAEQWIDPVTSDWARTFPAEQLRGLPIAYPAALEPMLAELGPALAGQVEWKSIDPVLCGPQGSGRQTLAAQLAAALGLPLLAVATPMIPGLATPAAEGRIDSLIRAARQARATASLLYWRDAEAVTAQEWNELRAMGVRSLRGAEQPQANATHSYRLKPLSTATRLEIWNWYSHAAAPAIVRTQRLTPGEIRLAATATVATHG